MIVSLCRKLWCSKCWNQLVGNLVFICMQKINFISNSFFNPILGGGGGGTGGLDCGVHHYKNSWIFQKRLKAFNIYYLGPFSQNFRSVSLLLRRLEPFCWGWLEKFCLVAKIQHFLPYRYLTFCQAKYTMDAVLLCQHDFW